MTWYLHPISRTCIDHVLLTVMLLQLCTSWVALYAIEHWLRIGSCTANATGHITPTCYYCVLQNIDICSGSSAESCSLCCPACRTLWSTLRYGVATVDTSSALCYIVCWRCIKHDCSIALHYAVTYTTVNKTYLVPVRLELNTSMSPIRHKLSKASSSRVYHEVRCSKCSAWVNKRTVVCAQRVVSQRALLRTLHVYESPATYGENVHSISDHLFRSCANKSLILSFAWW